MVDSALPSDSHSIPLETLILSQGERERLVSRMALRIRESLDLPEILQTCAAELQGLLNGDRLLITQINDLSNFWVDRLARFFTVGTARWHTAIAEELPTLGLIVG